METTENEVSLLNYQQAGREHDLPSPTVPCMLSIDPPQCYKSTRYYALLQNKNKINDPLL